MTVKMAGRAAADAVSRCYQRTYDDWIFFSYLWVITKVLGLTVPIIYNRMKGEQYDILIFTYRCLLDWFSWGRSFTINFVKKSFLLLTN